VDPVSLHEFARSTYPRLVAAVALITGSRASAEDAVQEALARAWERSARGETIESLPAWTTTVSVNLARSSLRRVLAERRAGTRLPDTAPARADDEELVDLRRALAGLPRRQREAIVLRYYLDLDVADVARAMGAPEGTAKSLLSRGRAALADALRIDDPEEVPQHDEAR